MCTVLKKTYRYLTMVRFQNLMTFVYVTNKKWFHWYRTMSHLMLFTYKTMRNLVPFVQNAAEFDSIVYDVVIVQYKILFSLQGTLQPKKRRRGKSWFLLVSSNEEINPVQSRICSILIRFYIYIAQESKFDMEPVRFEINQVLMYRPAKNTFLFTKCIILVRYVLCHIFEFLSISRTIFAKPYEESNTCICQILIGFPCYINRYHLTSPSLL